MGPRTDAAILRTIGDSDVTRGVTARQCSGGGYGRGQDGVISRWMALQMEARARRECSGDAPRRLSSQPTVGAALAAMIQRYLSGPNAAFRTLHDVDVNVVDAALGANAEASQIAAKAAPTWGCVRGVDGGSGAGDGRWGTATEDGDGRKPRRHEAHEERLGDGDGTKLALGATTATAASWKLAVPVGYVGARGGGVRESGVDRF